MAAPKPDESTLFKLRAPHRRQVWRTDRLELDALNKYALASTAVTVIAQMRR